MPRSDALNKPKSEDRFLQKVAQYRKETMEINELLSRQQLEHSELKRLKVLLLQDATDRHKEKIAWTEWEQILEERVVVSPSKKELSLLAQMLCMI